ncbi:hypothetical protein DB347_01510 [Opitutaceae bacterium EW11]|nr:hypothetical protein DB347_01510 [Opitutaceae bacterium EW11]
MSHSDSERQRAVKQRSCHSRTAGRIPSLDGFRAIAIGLVLLAHAAHTLPPEFEAPKKLLQVGGLGVSVFFVISGYLITTLMVREEARAGSVDLTEFYLRRAFRILPPFYTYLTVIILLSVLGIFVLAPQVILNGALFITNYKHYWTPNDGPNYWFVGHFWTLSLEEQFYLLWPAIFCIAGRRRALPAALVLIGLVQACRVATHYFDAQSRGQIDMMLHTSLDSLMTGCVMSLAETNRAYHRMVETLRSSTAAIIALFIVLGPPIAPYFLGQYYAYYLPTIGRLLGLGSIAVLILWAIHNEGSWAGRVLNSRPFVYVGVLSYSLYLWQQLFLSPVNHSWLGQFPQNLLLTFVAAQLSYTLVETPFLRMRGRVEEHVRRIRSKKGTPHLQPEVAATTEK